MSSSIKNLYQFRTTSKITQAQGAASTFTVGNDIFTNTAVSITAWSIQLTNRTGSIVELFTVTVAAWVATIATRGIKPDWTTDAIYQYERPKNTLCTLTVLENQIFDKWGSETLTGNLTYSWNVIYTKSAKFPVYADATARDAWIPSPANGMMIYNTALWVNQQYIGGSWVDVDTWSAVSNATITSTGVWELWELSEVAAWTATWWAWPLIVTPDVLAKQIQSWSYISLASATDSWTDTYVTTATPTLTAYTTGALFVVTFAETNTTTTPTLNIDWLWAVTITDKDSVALAVWDITTNKLILMKVWSAFKIMTIDSTTKKEVIKAAWENITAGNALRLAFNWAWETLTWTTTIDSNQRIGYDTSDFGWWTKFTVANIWVVTSISFYLAKVGSPTWVLTAYIYTENNLLVGISSTTVNESWLTGSDQSFTFSTVLLPWIYYAYVTANRAVSTTNYTNLWYDTSPSPSYSWWNTIQVNINWWIINYSSTVDTRFTITIWAISETDGRVYKAQATDYYRSLILWFAKNTATTWNNVTIDQTYNNKQTGLTKYATYYLSNTAWDISTSAWTFSRVVWRSISTTELLINLFW